MEKLTIFSNLINRITDIRLHTEDTYGLNEGWESLQISGNHPDWGSLWFWLPAWSTLIGICTVLIIWLICVLFKKYASQKIKSISLRIPFLLVWIYGFVVYDVGMVTGEKWSLLTNAPLAIVYAFKIFLFDSDVSEVQDVFHHNWWFSFNFSLVHFLAAVISTLFVIKVFGYNLISSFKLWYTSLLGKQAKETYIVWGFNDASYRLIKSIHAHYQNHEKRTTPSDTKRNGRRLKFFANWLRNKNVEIQDYRIIIVRTNHNEDDSPEQQAAFTRIFGLFSSPSSEMEKLQQIDFCYLSGSYVNLQSFNPGAEKDIIGGKLRLKSLKRIIENKTTEKIHMLFLSDSEGDNLHDVLLMKTDSSLETFTKKYDGSQKGKVVFYCHARYNSVHRVIEDQNPSDSLEVRVVDSSHINIDMLKKNEDLLPVNFVDVNKDASVSTAFNAMVIGFGELGRDIVKYVYEYGAFVKSGGDDNIAERSPFHLDVVDKDMAEVAGTFIFNSPAIKPYMSFLNDDNKNQDALISLHNIDCRSVEFYLKLEEWIKELNYIVLATGDDELNITLGVRILEAAIRYRKDLDNFCILVRAHNDADSHINNIAQHYNRLWAAYKVSTPDEKGRKIHQNEIKSEQIMSLPIQIFGLDKEVFTYDNIISNENLQSAKKYKNIYERSLDPTIKNDQDIWEERYKEMMLLEGPWKEYYPTYWAILHLRRTQTQDFANFWHETTKRILVEKALEKCGLLDTTSINSNNCENKKEKIEIELQIKELYKNLMREELTLNYFYSEEVQELRALTRIAMVLAQTEHLRWIASHEIIGYIYSPEKDELRLHHNCLVPWQEMSDPIRSYDNNIGDYLLGIRKKTSN